MSIADSNKVDRILSGKIKKYTVTIHRESGERIEYQSEKVPKLDWNSEARALWLNDGDYPSTPVIQHEPGMVVLCEENPKV